jgi:hypothetical protein
MTTILTMMTIRVTHAMFTACRRLARDVTVFAAVSLVFHNYASDLAFFGLVR